VINESLQNWKILAYSVLLALSLLYNAHLLEVMEKDIAFIK